MGREDPVGAAWLGGHEDHRGGEALPCSHHQIVVSSIAFAACSHRDGEYERRRGSSLLIISVTRLPARGRWKPHIAAIKTSGRLGELSAR
jgi:hypothetical protein